MRGRGEGGGQERQLWVNVDHSGCKSWNGYSEIKFSWLTGMHRKVYFIILLRYDLNNMRDLYTTWEFAGFVFVLLYVLDEDDYSYISY